MSRLKITVATGDYDRVRPIIDGRVQVEGCDVNYITAGPEELFWRAFTNGEFDVTEVSGSTYMMALSRGGCAYTAIPVFMSRSFRHSAFYVRADGGIKSPNDLRGREVGIPEYQMTALLWARGLLEDQYGISASSIKWLNGGLEDPGRIEKIKLDLPSNISLDSIPKENTLSNMLSSGELSAIITAREPSCFIHDPNVVRLFPDFRSAEQNYFTQTGIFPIMHMIAIRNELIKDNPWLAASLFKAFEQSKRLCLAELEQVVALKVCLPWLVAEIENTQAVMGKDYWPYGVEQNLKTLEAMVKYSYDQGLSARQLSVEELFVPSTLAAAKI